MFFAHKKYLRNFILFVLKYLSISTRNLQTSEAIDRDIDIYFLLM